MPKATVVFTVVLALASLALADNPKPPSLPDFSPAVAAKLAVSQAERDILSIGRQMDALVLQYKELQAKDAEAQKRMQGAVEEIFKAAGDPKREKFDFNPESLELTPKKPATTTAPAEAPKK